MKFLLGLALKNLTRYRRRTLITAAAIAFGLMLYIFMDGWLQGAEDESERNLIWYETGSARIMTAEYWDRYEQHSVKYALDGSGEIIDALDRMGYAAAPRTTFNGEIIMREDPFEQDGSMPIRVIAMDPALDEEVFHFRETISDGRFIENGEEGVLLGSWLAEDIGAEVGYPLTIVTRTREGFYQTIDVEIVGIVKCPNPVVNRSTIFIPLSTADLYLQMEGGVTEIAVRFPPRGNDQQMAPKVSAEIAAALADRYPGLEVVPWNVLAKDYVAIASAKQGGSSIILFLVFIIAAVGISNTMLMAIFERTRELGMMRALGMTDAQIRRAFLFEAGGIGFLGSITGITLGCLLNWYMVTYGIDLSFILREMDVGYRIAGISRSSWNIGVIVISFLSGILMSMLVALMPTRRALGMEITDCLRDA